MTVYLFLLFFEFFEIKPQCGEILDRLLRFRTRLQLVHLDEPPLCQMALLGDIEKLLDLVQRVFIELKAVLV